MKDAVLDLIPLTCPYPHVGTDNVFHDGLVVALPEACRRCAKRYCLGVLKTGPTGSFQQCPRGFTLFKGAFHKMPLLINGILVSGSCGDFPRKAKKRLASQLVREDHVRTWYKKVQCMISQFDALVEEKTNTTLGMLHDVNTAVSLIFRNAEVLMNEEAGYSFDEKVENASPHKKALFKSVSLLEERLKMMNLVTNTDAACHGQRAPMPIYKIVDKTVKIFYPIARRRRVYIKLRGTSYGVPLLYESFTTIPLVLIDNAVKYSLSDQTVDVAVEDNASGVKVSVKSYSPRIYGDEKTHIFEKYGRGINAPTVASTGSGLGLYLANVVAQANGFEIKQQEVGHPVNLNGMEYIDNVFYFLVG